MFPFSSAKKMAPIALNPTLCSTAKYPLRHQGIGEALTLHVGVRRLTGLNVQTSLAEQLNSIAGEEEKTNMKIHPWSEMFQRITEQGDVCQAYIQNTWEVFEESLDDWAPTGAFKNGLSPEVRFDGRGKVGKRDSMTRLVWNWACVCLCLRRTWGQSREMFNHIQLLSWRIGKYQACVSVY